MSFRSSFLIKKIWELVQRTRSLIRVMFFRSVGVTLAGRMELFLMGM